MFKFSNVLKIVGIGVIIGVICKLSYNLFDYLLEDVDDFYDDFDDFDDSYLDDDDIFEGN